MNYDDLKEYSKEIEAIRQILLKEKFALLEKNNATCYRELKDDNKKYWYRKLTENLRMINKSQDQIKNHKNSIAELYKNIVLTANTLKAPKSDKTLPYTFAFYKEHIIHNSKD
jgi:hypothetical protein